MSKLKGDKKSKEKQSSSKPEYHLGVSTAPVEPRYTEIEIPYLEQISDKSENEGNSDKISFEDFVQKFSHPKDDQDLRNISP